MTLRLRSIGQNDYSVLEGDQLIGRIRYASERTPRVWLWHVQVHLTGGLPMGTARDLETAKSEFKAGWTRLKSRTTPEQLEAAYRARTSEERTALTRMMRFCTRALQRLSSGLTQILAELISAMEDRPDDARLLMKEAWAEFRAEFQGLPAEEQRRSTRRSSSWRPKWTSRRS